MNQKQAIQKIKISWQEILENWKGRAPADRNGAPTYVCPICGNGSGGKDGDGICYNPKSRGGLQLSCFNCNFHGDIIDLYIKANGLDPRRDFPRAVNELAQKIGLVIDRPDVDGIHADEIIQNARKMIQVATIGRDAMMTSEGWKNESLDFSEFEKRFTKPTLADVSRSDLAEKTDDERKNEKGRAGGFVGGFLRNGYRSNNTLEGRSLWTADIDNCPAAFFEKLHEDGALPFRAFIYSTFNHSPDAPRLRIVAPFSRVVAPSEYRTLATYIELKLAASFKLPDLFDFHGALPGQLMYIPFCPSDAGRDYFFKSYSGPVLDVDALMDERPRMEGVLRKVLASVRGAANAADDIVKARENIFDPRALEYLKTRGLGVDKAGRIFAAALRVGFVFERDGRPTAALLVPTGADSYFLRDLRPESELTAKEKEYTKLAVGTRRLFNPSAILDDAPTYIVEGEIDALSVIEAGGKATGLGGVKMTGALLDFIQQNGVRAPLIIALDNDAEGRRAAQKLKHDLDALGVAWIERNLGGRFKDANEFLQADRAGFYRTVATFTEEARELIPIKGEEPDGVQSTEEVVKNSEPVKTALGLMSVADFCADFSAGNWLVDRWIPDGGLSMIFGAPGSCKSFVAVDLALTLASDLASWKGYKVRRLAPDEPRPVVVYLAGEGYTGLKARVLAWLRHYNETSAASSGQYFDPLTLEKLRDRLVFSQRAVDLYTADGAQKVINEIKTLGRPVEYVLVDTLARFFHGDENSAQDAGQLVGACAEIHNIFGSAVTLLHHSGVALDAQNRSRGSSAFLGALDTQILIESGREVKDDPSTPKLARLTQRKQKDIDEAPPLWLQLEPVDLPEFVNPLTGETLTSAVVIPTELRPKEWKNQKIKTSPTENQKTLDKMSAARADIFSNFDGLD